MIKKESNIEHFLASQNSLNEFKSRISNQLRFLKNYLNITISDIEKNSTLSPSTIVRVLSYDNTEITSESYRLETAYIIFHSIREKCLYDYYPAYKLIIELWDKCNEDEQEALLKLLKINKKD